MADVKRFNVGIHRVLNQMNGKIGQDVQNKLVVKSRFIMNILIS